MYEECDSNMRLKGTLFLVDFPNGSWIMDQIIVGIFKRMNGIDLVLEFSKSKRKIHYNRGFLKEKFPIKNYFLLSLERFDFVFIFIVNFAE